MFLEKYKPIVKGYIKAFISDSSLAPQTGGTDEVAYCYSTWLRHLIKLNKHVSGVPENVAELGPGDTLGIGIAALLSGAKSYVGLDIKQYWNPEANVKMFDQLVALFTERASLADETKYPNLTPYLNTYEFPRHILSDAWMQETLASSRLAEIRKELSDLAFTNKYVKFYSPWTTDNIADDSIDFAFSQAVLQYTDLSYVYASIQRWLKTGGHMAHSIDFSSHGITKTWNGHWAFSKREWKHYSFRKKMLLNRAHFSMHKQLQESLRFQLIEVDKYRRENNLKANQLGEAFKNMSREDIATGAAYMLSVKQ